MFKGDYPLKHARLKQLYDAGFNIADFVCFAPGKLDPVRLKKFFDKYKDKHGVSLRHFHQDEKRYWKCPVLFEVKDWKTALRFCQEHNKLFYSLINEGMPRTEALYAGNFLLIDDSIFVIEWGKGGSPRDLEDKTPNTITGRMREPLPANTPLEFRPLPYLFSNFLPENRPIIIEFNIYPYAVGLRKNNLVVWEWRRGFNHETWEIAEELIQENRELKKKVEVLEELFIKLFKRQ